MKHELWYALSTATDILEEDITRLSNELEKLDPSASLAARFELARLSGTVAYMRQKVGEESKAIEVITANENDWEFNLIDRGNGVKGMAVF